MLVELGGDGPDVLDDRKLDPRLGWPSGDPPEAHADQGVVQPRHGDGGDERAIAVRDRLGYHHIRLSPQHRQPVHLGQLLRGAAADLGRDSQNEALAVRADDTKYSVILVLEEIGFRLVLDLIMPERDSCPLLQPYLLLVSECVKMRHKVGHGAHSFKVARDPGSRASIVGSDTRAR
jgi:hypothetical protein